MLNESNVHVPTVPASGARQIGMSVRRYLEPLSFTVIRIAAILLPDDFGRDMRCAKIFRCAGYEPYSLK